MICTDKCLTIFYLTREKLSKYLQSFVNCTTTGDMMKVLMLDAQQGKP